MKTFSRGALLGAALSIAAAIACNDTAGVPIELAIVFEARGSGAFTTVSGWEVELTEARGAVGVLYAYAPAGETARRMSPFAISRAYAHGGHVQNGRLVRAELLEAYVLDALAPEPIEVARVAGLAGRISELTVVLDVSGQLADGPTRGHHVWIRGTARRGDEQIEIQGGLVLADERHRRIQDIAVEPEAELASGSRLVVGADPRGWLAEADFGALAGGSIVEGTQPHRALWLGARSASSWSVRVERMEEE